jgi:putative aldouronate transport system permease protein
MQLYIFILLPIIYLLIFAYYPMFGVQIAFKNFTPVRGIWGSPWVGFNHFINFFNSYYFQRVMVNTIVLSIYTILAGFPLPIVFALMLNIVRNEKYKKIIQTVTYVPHFISTVVLVGMLATLFNPLSGAYGSIYQYLHNGQYPAAIYGIAASFRHFYVWSGVWQQLGWNTIIYIAALAAVNPELHEAAEIDGANRWKRIIHIDFPAILPTAVILFILQFGSLMSIGYEKVLLMQTNLNLQASEIISTYVYKVGLQSGSNYSSATAIGLFNSIINLFLLMSVNRLTRRMSGGDYSLF